MTQGITEKEPDARQIYGDIIDLPHPRSKKHPPMSLYDRAAQFASYKALSGYEEMVGEEARQVDRRIELTGEELDILSHKLTLISESIAAGVQPVLSVTWFIPDPLKAGGRYETATEQIRRVDATRGKLILARTEGYGKNYAEIDFRDLLDLREEAE